MVSKHGRYRQAKASLGESAELVAAREDFEATEEELAERRSHLRSSEMELSSLDTKIAEVKKSLYSGRIRNPKELEGLQQDAEYLARRRDQLEDEILEQMSLVEGLQGDVASNEAQLESLEAAWSADQADLAQEIQELAARIRTLQAERTKVCAGIEQSQLVEYNEVRRRKAGQALSVLSGGKCQVCNLSIPEGKLQRVREKQAIVLCDGCGRILYAL